MIFWLILAHIKFKKQKNHLFKKKTMKKLFVFTLTLPLLINCGGGEEIKNEESIEGEGRGFIDDLVESD